MKIKTFRENPIIKLLNLKPLAPLQANKFIETVELGDKGSVQYADGIITVFYSHTKAEQNVKTIKDMIEGLEATVFNTNIRLISLQTDIQLHTDETKIKETQDLINETEKNLALYRARIKAFQEHLHQITVL